MSNLYEPQYLVGTGYPLDWSCTCTPKIAEAPKNINILHRAAVYIETNITKLTEADVRYHINVCEVGLDDIRKYGSKRFGSDGVKAVNKARHGLALIQASILYSSLSAELRRDVNAVVLGLSRVLHTH